MKQPEYILPNGTRVRTNVAAHSADNANDITYNVGSTWL